MNLAFEIQPVGGNDPLFCVALHSEPYHYPHREVFLGKLVPININISIHSAPSLLMWCLLPGYVTAEGTHTRTMFSLRPSCLPCQDKRLEHISLNDPLLLPLSFFHKKG